MDYTAEQRRLEKIKNILEKKKEELQELEAEKKN